MEGRHWGPLIGRGPLTGILSCLLCLWYCSEPAAAFQLKGAPSPFWIPPVRQGPFEVPIEPHHWAHPRAAGAPWGPHTSASSPQGPTIVGLHAPRMQLRPPHLFTHYAVDSLASADEEDEGDSAEILRENPTQTQNPSGEKTRDFSWGTRKQSYARVRLLEGTGRLTINQRNGEEYLQGNDFWLLNCRAPLMEVKAEHKYDVEAQVKGGGLGGQSGAIMLAVARELCRQQPHLRPVLKRSGFLTVDSRRVERKKFGLKKARKRPQYSKR
ncbi:hypothetical protein Emed_005838 [Eimeria media]